MMNETKNETKNFFPCLPPFKVDIPYSKNFGGKKVWRIATNSPKFFLPISHDEARDHTICVAEGTRKIS